MSESASAAAALAFAGVPPGGLGVFARGHALAAPFSFNVGGDGARWRFVNVTEGEAPVVLGNIARAVRRCIETAQSGVIVDSETAFTEAQIDSLAETLNEASTRVRIGFTSFSFWGGLTRLSQRLSRRVFGAPQLFSDASTNSRAWAHWSQLFGAGRLIPCAKGYVVGAHTTDAMAAQLRTDAGYRAYLASIPRAGGVIVWPNWPLLPHMGPALYDRWGSPLARLMGTARAAVLSPQLAAAALLIVLAIAAALALVLRG